MPVPSDNVIRWAASARNTDVALPHILAQRGMLKDDMSGFVENSAQWLMFRQSLSEVRENLAVVPADELQSMVDEATQSVEDEMRRELSGKSR